MCTPRSETVLTLPDDIHREKENRAVAIDACIVDQIRQLWSEGVQTLGCCCGHGEEDPSVVLANGYTAPEIANIAHVLELADTRSWQVLQWQLVTACRTHAALTTNHEGS